MARRTPQEKKRLSYQKDRRNTFGQSTQASRKAIPLHKALVERQNRKAARQALTQVGAAPDDAGAEKRLNGRKSKTWRKYPDEPLGAVVKRKLARRR
jgi:hypothetical protein